MDAGDLQDLARLLDKNADFTRPQGQSTGFSLQEKAQGADAKAAAAAADGKGSAAGPASIALPATVIDQQLRLPMPSHSTRNNAAKKAAESAAAIAAQRRYFVSDDIWTQDELRRMCAAMPPSAPKTANENVRLENNGDAAVALAADAEEPSYSVLFRQRLTAEDVYLGVDFTRDGSSATSDDAVVVRVDLPRLQDARAVTLRAEPYTLHLSGPPHYTPLRVALPRPVRQDKVDARWDGTTKQLSVTLLIDNTDKV